MPEDVDLPMNSNEERGQIPGKEPGHIGQFSLSDMEAALGLELLGTVDLGADNLGYDVFDPNGLRSELPPVTANAPLEIFRVLAQTEGDDIFAFVGEFAPPTYLGASLVVATGDTDGTDETDWIILPQTAQSGTLNGAGGDDHLITGANGAALIGGAGDDKLSALADATTIAGGAGQDDIASSGTEIEVSGGAGNDDIRASGSGVVNGGAGDDDIFASGGDVSASGGIYGMELENITITDAPLVLNGGDGDDTIQAYGATAEANGGAGNDLLALIDGATGYGQAGDDTIRIDRDGGIAYGGEGDDIIRVSLSGIADGGEGADTITAFVSGTAETLSLSGGAGVDTFQVATSIYNPTNVYQSVTIPDFDPTQEVIEILGYEGGSIQNVTVLSGDQDPPIRVVVEVSPQANTVPRAGLSTNIDTLTFVLEGNPTVTASNFVLA